MKKLYLILAVLFCLIHQLSACEIIEKSIKPSGEYEERLIPFLKNNEGVELSLPLHTAYSSIKSNEKKTIWIINFHQTSNYEGADLVICNQGNPIIVKDIFHYLENQLINKKIIPKYPWGNQILRVKISGNILTCLFYGVDFSQQRSVTRTFKAFVSLNSNGVTFKILTKNN